MKVCNTTRVRTIRHSKTQRDLDQREPLIDDQRHDPKQEHACGAHEHRDENGGGGGARVVGEEEPRHLGHTLGGDERVREEGVEQRGVPTALAPYGVQHKCLQNEASTQEQKELNMC